VYSTTNYFKWSRRFKYILNAVVVYTDSEKFADLIKSVRSTTSTRTKVILIERNTSWSFKTRSRIAELLKQFSDNINPDYVCAQLAKYDVMSRASKDNHFQTEYFMWLDIGYFRSRRNMGDVIFKQPMNVELSKIAVGLLSFSDKSTFASPKVIFQNSVVWVDTGLVFGARNVMLDFAEQFKASVFYFLSQDLINTDRQVILATFSDEGRQALKPKVELQLYKPFSENDRFYLGNIMMQEEAR